MTKTVEGRVEPESRDELIAKMGKQHADSMKAELTPVDDFVPVEDPDEEPLVETKEETPPEPEPKGDAKAPAQDASPSEAAPAKEEDPYLTVMVDGHREQYRKSEIDAQGGVEVFQKRRAADRRLEEATLARKEVLELRRELQEAIATSKKEKAPEAPAPLPVNEITKRMRGIERKIYLEAGTQEEVDKLLEEKERLQEEWFEAKARQRGEMEAQTRQEAKQKEDFAKLVDTLAERHPDWQTVQEGEAFHSWLQAQPMMYRAAWVRAEDTSSVVAVMDAFKASTKPVSGFDETRRKKEAIDVVQTASKKAEPPQEKRPPNDSEYVRTLAARRAELRGDA